MDRVQVNPGREARANYLRNKKKTGKKAGSLIEIYDKEEERRNKKVPRASVVRRDLKGEFGSSRCMKITKKKEKETGAVNNFSLFLIVNIYNI